MSVFHDEVEIEDFEFDPDTESYYYPCPCGDQFRITVVRRFVLRVSKEVTHITHTYRPLTGRSREWRKRGSVSQLFTDSEGHL